MRKHRELKSIKQLLIRNVMVAYILNRHLPAAEDYKQLENGDYHGGK